MIKILGTAMVFVLCLFLVKFLLSIFFTFIDKKENRIIVHISLIFLAGMISYPGGISDDNIKYGIYLGMAYYFFLAFAKE